MQSHLNKFKKLEAIRGFAAIYVVIGHLVKKSFVIGGINFAYPFRFGQEAVILFFVLSGIVIQYSFAKTKNKSFKLFFLKRFLRIYIPLLLVFIANYLVLCMTKGLFISISWSELTGNIAMLQDYSRVKPGTLFEPFLGNLPLWSLSYEWWFYFLFFYLYNKFGQQAGLYAYSLSILATASYLFYPTFIARVFMYLAIWWAGADIGLLYFQQKTISIKALRVPLITLICCVVLLIINSYYNAEKMATLLHDSGFGVSPILELRHFSFALFIIPVAVIWRAFNWIGFNKFFGFFEPTASISFGLYISHWFLLANANYLANFTDSKTIQFTAYLLICLSFSFLIERKIYPFISQLLLRYLYKPSIIEILVTYT